MDGIFIDWTNRPKSKKAVKDAIAAGTTVCIDSTSMFGGYSGPITEAADGSYMFVGPCPHTKRNFYGTITKKGDKITVK